MASVTVVSQLTPEEQTGRLLEFVREQGCTLQPSDGLAICKSLQLHLPTHSNIASRRLQEDLAARGISVTRSICCEALARLCGGQNWMRVRHQMLSLNSQRAQEEGVLCFCAHFSREDGATSEPVLKLAFHELAEAILKRVSEVWPTAPALALCTVAAGKQSVTLELEHADAPWISVRIWSFRSSAKYSESSLPPLEDLPDSEVHAMLERVERTLEYTYPGLLVIGATRSARLPAHFLFTPDLQGEGFRRTCAGAMDTYMWLGSCENEFSAVGDGTFTLNTSEGNVVLQPKWTSEQTGAVERGPLDARQLQSILNRTSRLRRVTGLKMVEFLGQHAGGRGIRKAGNAGAQQLDVQAIAKGMEEKSWRAQDLANASGLPLNAVLRVLRYGYAQVELIPKLSSALGIPDPNRLLAEDEADQLGLRIDDAERFIRVLRDTHMWRLVLGNKLQGDEEEEVRAMADCLKEYVELLQFESSVLNGNVKTNDARLLEPLDERSIVADVQDLLDQLGSQGIGVLVAQNVRFMRGRGDFAHVNDTPLNQSTVFFEKIAHLQKPAVFS
jgi:hypothetical protein